MQITKEFFVNAMSDTLFQVQLVQLNLNGAISGPGSHAPGYDGAQIEDCTGEGASASKKVLAFSWSAKTATRNPYMAVHYLRSTPRSAPSRAQNIYFGEVLL